MSGTRAEALQQNRLTEPDRARLQERAEWLRGEGFTAFSGTVERSMANSIGLGIEDLRDSEIGEMARTWAATS